ncbi:alpha-L-rhamnosidase N-terminal domain-containing protein [Dyadobacter pollutisoli]|uniref:Alpha-L-rhamnosidase N-terminal domain-containing protein n=1 Tax=Dyadobacter pollutisoli TaxID=2910158 RepID=A0A9E8SMX6_9BACT|nr:alpha-L-rhamnosidase N-terminal domain-containing protein [Dyadobacter pollutisoli]WAC13201.1 alpha-L-rhamnosidase N-terminal domain-containing protein [Dyadobacter pollutisoli]
MGQWSKVAIWEMGLLSKNDWQAQWIGVDPDHLGKGKTYHLPPAPYLRKEIFIKNTMTNARLYVSALRLYEFSIYGKKAGDAFLTPGWTDYDKSLLSDL